MGLDCGVDPCQEKEFNAYCDDVIRRGKDREIKEQTVTIKYLKKSFEMVLDRLMELQQTVDDLSIEVSKLKFSKDVVHLENIKL